LCHVTSFDPENVGEHDPRLTQIAAEIGSRWRQARATRGIDSSRTSTLDPPNGKVERFHRTLLEGWAYVRPFASNELRVHLLEERLHLYNHHRSHTALGGLSPVAQLNNLSGNYT
jgi:transposase InsO family protein